MKLTPKAPQGPSNEELNRIPSDPYLPPYGGSGALFADLVSGPYMDPGRATSVITVIGDRTKIGSQRIRNFP
jgi:hypothetical protein